jgi:hypothetical protein
MVDERRQYDKSMKAEINAAIAREERRRGAQVIAEDEVKGRR